MTEAANPLLSHFSNPETVARYAEGPRRSVPGFDDLHRLTGILLNERAPADAGVLIVGAGGGLEINALAKTYPRWTFVGVDPAHEMLKLAERTLGSLASRTRFHHGYIDDAPEGPFDAATCLLTLHFLAAGERLHTLYEIRRRLKRGAAFVAIHYSFPQEKAKRTQWLSRHVSFVLGPNADPVQANAMRIALETHLPLLNPEEDEAILREAGFVDVKMFYAAFTWRGWVAYA